MKIVWSKSAVSDLEAIRDYIARDSEYYAARFVGRIVETAGSLRRFPESGPLVPEFAEYGVRERLLRNYRILYEVRTNHVLVLAVVHTSRDLGSLTLEH